MRIFMNIVENSNDLIETIVRSDMERQIKDKIDRVLIEVFSCSDE